MNAMESYSFLELLVQQRTIFLSKCKIFARTLKKMLVFSVFNKLFVKCDRTDEKSDINHFYLNHFTIVAVLVKDFLESNKKYSIKIKTK